MYLEVTVTKNQKKFSDVGARLIRAEAGFNVQQDGTGTKLTYPYNQRDRRIKNTSLELSDAVADYRTAMDLAYNAASILLPVYPDNNISLTAVNGSFEVGDLLWGKAYEPDATKSWVWIMEGAFEVKKLLVNYTLTNIVNLAGTGIP